MKIYIGADHRGFELKQRLKSWLEEQGHEVTDKGAFTHDPRDDYPDFAFAVAQAVSLDKASTGLLICGSSIGVCVAANKVQGIFASIVRTPQEAKEDRVHHNPNVLCFSADNMDEETIKASITASFEAQFEGGRHQRRLDKIFEYEAQP